MSSMFSPDSYSLCNIILNIFLEIYNFSMVNNLPVEMTLTIEVFSIGNEMVILSPLLISVDN